MRAKKRLGLLLISTLLALLIVWTLRISYQGNQYEITIQDVLGHHVTIGPDNDQSEFRKNRQESLRSFDSDIFPSDQRIIRWDDPRLVIHHLDVYNLSKPARMGEYDCVEMRTAPLTPICIYDEGSDVYISHDLKHTGLWEPAVFYDFIDVLKRDPELGVIDIGANIGVYSLVPAQMGHKVVAVEPFKESVKRLHLAAKMGKSDGRIVLLHNAVAERRTEATLITSGNNQGDTRIVLGAQRCTGSCPDKVRTILIDDIRLVITFEKAVMKIDCQGFEHKAFRFAKKLLSEVNIEYIYMEWMVMRELFHSRDRNEKKLVINLINQLLDGRYRPYNVNSKGGEALDPTDWQNWPTDIVWRHLPDNKEYRQLLKNHFMQWP